MRSEVLNLSKDFAVVVDKIVMTIVIFAILLKIKFNAFINNDEKKYY